MKTQITDVDKYVETIITAEKESELTPFFATRTMAGIQALEFKKHRSKKLMTKLVYNTVFAASIAITIYVGTTIGNLAPVKAVEKTNFIDYTNIETFTVIK